MNIFYDLAAWKKKRAEQANTSSLGFVPTMGNLHVGHLSLIQSSRNENTETLVSLYVNPTQFNQPDDFTHYPRTLDADLEALQRAGVTHCLLPESHAMYPDDYSYQLMETNHSLHLEGTHRPGHFNGVLTVVLKLFNLVKPTRAYFGEKDYQQLSLIRGMTRALFLDIEIKACATVREESGLACSSRNQRLSPAGKLKAIAFAQCFRQALSCAQITEELKQRDITVDYIEEHQGRRFAAVTIDGVRLIDNYAINPHAPDQTPA